MRELLLSGNEDFRLQQNLGAESGLPRESVSALGWRMPDGLHPSSVHMAYAHWHNTD